MPGEVVTIGDGIGASLIVILLMIVLDTVFGVIQSLVGPGKRFDCRKLPQFIATGVLPYFGGIFLLALVAMLFNGPFTALFYGSSATVVAKYTADIRHKISAIYRNIR